MSSEESTTFNEQFRENVKKSDVIYIYIYIERERERERDFQ